MEKRNQRSFVIDGLPRTGSTTLAHLVACHPEIKCLIEPFHPRRYESQFHRMALAAGSVVPVLALLRHRWIGLKHVWEPSNGWPFIANPKLNDELVLEGGHIVFVRRRNLLRRYVSGAISNRLKFWIGTRTEFFERLQEISLPEFDPEAVRREIEQDRLAIDARARLLEAHRIPTFAIDYEDMYGETVSEDQQFETLNSIFDFLSFSPISNQQFLDTCLSLLNRDTYQWSSDEVYEQIPGIHTLDEAVGSAENGWLFR